MAADGLYYVNIVKAETVLRLYTSVREAWMCFCAFVVILSFLTCESEISLSGIWMKRVIHSPTQTANITTSLCFLSSSPVVCCLCFPSFFLSLHLPSSLSSLLYWGCTAGWHHPGAFIDPGCVCVCLCLWLSRRSIFCTGGQDMNPWPLDLESWHIHIQR